ncbi:uncharacterized protein LOC111639769 [Centruroides sculpturatus]|uniref:uncharacterized protein LOC111639769 n=1 Tax=Centruroides sculpturatus TaxID=218467 RepID=UPI000C6D80E1|nr:uncharacterized protein LOC111639769 [Centruroides sculpturatus]XP_023241476.1 uncharacterized protein LOC111639769 [Centruroides sculpturatus]
MDKPENKCELVCNSRSKKNLNVAYVYDIMIRILKTLDNSEIKNCMKVCSFWKEIGEFILRGRITIAVEALPRDIIAITNFYPEYVVRYFKTQNGNMNILTGYNGYLDEKKDRSDKTKIKRHLLRLDAQFRKNNHIKERRYSQRLVKLYSSPSRNLLPIWIAVFPQLPGLKISRFVFSKNEIEEKLKPGPTWFTELTDISKEETKCVLWIVDDELDDTFKKVIPQCAVSGISDISLGRTYRCIVFSGRMVHALSFNLPTDLTLQQMKITELKQYNIAWNNCIVLFFNQTFMNWCNNRSGFPELENFSKEFPNIPILFYSSYLSFGVEYIPNISENTSTIEECIEIASVAKIVLLWIA